MHGKTDQIHHDGKSIYLGMPNPFLKLEWDFRLAPESGVKARKKIAASDALA